MKPFFSSRHSLLTRLCAVVTIAIIAMLLGLGTGCESGTKEGERCNPLVLQDECKAGLHCKPATCSEAYCCPTDRSSTDPNCNAKGCPDETDAGEQGASDAAEADSGIEQGLDAATSDADADAGDGGAR